jgi:putative peptide zinc metalloprotease protein
VVRRQVYEGRTHYVVKDPVGLRYFRFKEEEYFLLRNFDGKKRLEELKDDYEREFRPQQITIEELARFASQLTQAGIASVDASGQGQVLYDRFRKSRLRQRLAAWTNVLYIKIPIFDPDKLLTRMLPLLRWIFHPVTVWATVLLWGVAFLWVMSHYDEFQARLPQFYTFFNWHNMVFMWLALGVVKIIHEFGHGLTCKYFGGECHEMGALFLVLSPCLYCDVSDSWLLPNKWHRVWIGAAGIYVELTMAAICTFVWWNTDIGLINNLALSTMFVCSVNTVLFNGNPLLRYDGYYMLMDIMEIPNLRAKAARFFSSVFGKFCLGLPTDTESYLPRARRVFFFIFAVASYIYRWFISFAILWFLYRFLRPYKLSTISAFLALASLSTLLVVPSYQLGKFIWESRRTSTVSKLRLIATISVLGAAAAFVFGVPLPLNVKASFVLVPQSPEYVWVEVPGMLTEQFVKDGDKVQQDRLLGVLHNPTKLGEKLSVETLRDQHALMAQSKGRIGRFADVQAEEVLAAMYQEQVRTIQTDLDRLELRSHRAGVVMQPPKPEELGKFMQVDPGSPPFCQIGDPSKLEAWLVIDQGEIDLVHEDQDVKLKFYSHALRTFDGTVAEIPNVDVDKLPPELSSMAGGEVPTKEDPRTGQQKPIHTLYYAVVPLQNDGGLFQPGLRGVAKIRADKLTLGMRFWRWVKHTFHFEA